MSTQQYWLQDARSLSVKAGSTVPPKHLRFPPPHWIEGKVLADMLCGDHVSPETMWRRYSEILGSNGVNRLRQFGWPVQRSEVHFSDPRDGVTVMLTLYHLPPTAIVAAGDRCTVFLEQVRIASRQKLWWGEA